MLASRQSLWIPNIGAEPTLARPEALAAGLYAAVFVPVLVRDEVVAVLEFYCAERDEPDERLLEVMGNLGTQLGRVVERSARRARARAAAGGSSRRARRDRRGDLPQRPGRGSSLRQHGDGGAWRGLGIADEGSIWSRLLQLAERSADPAAFSEGVTSLAETPTESAGGEFELRTAAPSSPTASRSRTRTSSPDGSSSSARRPPTERWTAQGGVPRSVSHEPPHATDLGAGLRGIAAGGRLGSLDE